MREVLIASALPPDAQFARVDLEELFVYEGVRGVPWMFVEMHWLSAPEKHRLDRFEAAALDIFDLDDPWDEQVVRESVAWRNLRGAAAECLVAFAKDPWA